jgi:hypothetical protein
MEESGSDSIEIAECYFCGFRLVSDEHEEGGEKASTRLPKAAIVEKRVVFSVDRPGFSDRIVFAGEDDFFKDLRRLRMRLPQR